MNFPARILFAITAAACLLSRSAAAQTFTVHPDQIICDKWVGFGAQMNPWTYCEPNKQDVNEQNVKDLEQKVVAEAPACAGLRAAEMV